MAFGFIDYVIVFSTKLPSGSHGVSKLNPDGSFTIFLNPNDTHEMQQHGFIHEIEHIANGDFDNIQDKDVQVLEMYAHKLKGA